MPSITSVVAVITILLAPATVPARLTGQSASANPAQIAAIHRRLQATIDGLAGFTQRTVDQLYSYGELGFQEVESSGFLIRLLRERGFAITAPVAGLPTGWVARWGSGKPVIAFGADLDAIPQASQRPGIPWHDPLVEGAPGHGEGHNAGQAVIITAALALKQLMERDRLPGTLVIWPGIAEELLGGKAHLVREGIFAGVDACLYAHVGDNFDVSWGGDGSGSGLVSVQYTFVGEAAHAAAAPWRGRSALDAVELMDMGWNLRREHLRPQARVHYVVKDGGDQPNVVPSSASVWYYYRETTYPRIKDLFELGGTMARAAAEMASVRLANTRLFGSAWPGHFNRPLAEVAYRHMTAVGLPVWSEDDQAFARAVQREAGGPSLGLATVLDSIVGDVPDSLNVGGGSDDIGDVSWTVPTIEITFPANIPGLPGHHWASGAAMATPIAHKGSTAGAKVVASTALDLLLDRLLLERTHAYFAEQTRDHPYRSFLGPADRPATELNAAVMQRFRGAMRPYYFDPAKHRTYLEQLGVKYPTTTR